MLSARPDALGVLRVLLDRLDAVAALGGIAGVVAFTPLEAEPLMKALAPPGLRLVAQRGADLGERLSNILSGLLDAGHTAPELTAEILELRAPGHLRS